MLKISHYLNYKGHFYLCVHQKTNTFSGRLRTILEVSGRFRRVVTSYNTNEMFFLIVEFERAAKIRKIAAYLFLVSLPVPDAYNIKLIRTICSVSC